MWLIVGLGNPGAQYSNTRHNAGFIALDAIISRYHLRDMGNKHRGLCWKGRINDEDVVALAPQTFMNKSGISIADAARFYKVPANNIIVCYDELDLVAGKCRIKQGGGNGGHNGLRSIDQHCSKDYWRVRLGIDRPAHKSDVTNYVLGRFSADEYAVIDDLSRAIAEHLPYIMHSDPEKAMTAIALAMQARPS